MAITFPGTLDTLTNPSGTQTLDSPDHALQHANANDALEAIEAVLGTTGGTSVLKNFTAGQFAAKNNSDTFGSITVNAGTLKAVSGAGLVLGTPTITGGTITGGMVGTMTLTGGSITSMTLVNTLTGGTLATPVIGTPSIAVITTAATTTPTSFLRAVAPIIGTIADAPAGTITANAASQQLVEVTFGTTAGNRTVGTPTNPTDGQALSYRFKQNSANTGTLVWASVFRISSDVGTPSLGGTSTWNYSGWRYNATDTKWDFQGQSKNLT